MQIFKTLIWLATCIGISLNSARAEDSKFCKLDPKAQTSSVDMQRALIAIGLLNADPGSALTVEVRRAFARLKNNQDTPILDFLPAQQCAELLDLYRAFQSYTNFKKHTFGNNGPRLLIPGRIANDSSLHINHDDYNKYWDGDTRDWSFGFDLFQQSLAQTTPLIKQSQNDHYWIDLRFFYRQSTIHQTFSEGIGTFRHRLERMDRDVILAKRYFFYQNIYEHRGQTKGVYLKFSTQPPDWFDVPPFLRIALANRHLVEAIKAKYGALDNREVAWLLYAESVSNLIGSQFAVDNSLRVQINPIDRDGTASCDENQAPNVVAHRNLRVIFATTRDPEQRFKNQRWLTGDTSSTGLSELFGSQGDENGQLNIGCILIQTTEPRQPDSHRLKSHLRRRKEVIEFQVKEVLRQKAVTRIDQPYLQLADDRQCDEKKHDRRALLYVHGYNSSFSHAINQAINLAIESNYRGKLFVFSWPSHGKGWLSWLRYFSEIDKAEAAQPALQYFLNAILHDRNINTLDIVAHSMGTLQTLRSLEAVRHLFDRPVGDCREPDKPNSGRLRLGQVVLASPDVDSDVFVQKVSEISRFSERITVYVSRTDCVLGVSGTLRGVARAGKYNSLTGPVGFDPNRSQRVHVIDTTPESGPWRNLLCRDLSFGHADYANDELIRKDIARILDYKVVLSRRRSLPEVRYRQDASEPAGSSNVGICKVNPTGGGPAHWAIRRRDVDGKLNC